MAMQIMRLGGNLGTQTAYLIAAGFWLSVGPNGQ